MIPYIDYIHCKSKPWKTKQVNIILLIMITWLSDHYFRLNTNYSIIRDYTEVKSSTSYIDPEVSLVWSNNNYYCLTVLPLESWKLYSLEETTFCPRKITYQWQISINNYYYVAMSFNYLIYDNYCIYPMMLLSCHSGFLGGPAFSQIGIWIFGKRGNASWSSQ